MMVGYGFRRHEEDLRKAGAKRMWIDVSRERPERADMMREGGLREGDTLILLAENDLGGSAPANAKWRAMIEERGVTIRVKEPPKRPRKFGGRPKKFAPDPEQDRQIRELFLCDYLTAYHKVRRASEIMGHVVEYDQLYYRYITKAKRGQK